MTSWSCAACTYLNHIDPVGGSDDTNDDCDHNTPRYCEICQTPRETKEEEVDRGQGGAERRRQRGTGGKEEDANSYAAVVASSSASTADPAEDESSLLSQAGIFYSDDSDKISKSKNNSVNRKEKKRKKDSSALVQMTLMGTRASVDPPDGSSATAASMKKKKMRRIGNDQQKQYHPRPRPLHEELEENPPTAKTIAFSSAPVGGGSSSSSSSPSLLETEEKRIQRVMERVFGIQKLRPLQSEVVRQILTGRGGSRDRSFASLSTSLRANEPQNNHQIVVMATGAGKSICYQLPALVMSEEKKKKTCLVISPLVALMEDQVRSLQLRGVEADMMASNKSAEHNRHVLDRLLLVGSTKDLGTASVAATAAKSAVVASATAKGKKTSHHNHKPLALLYCTPEQIRRPYFRSLLLEMHRRRCISLLAIDEAHCISTWGHDFRPSYRELQWLSHNLRGVPLLACTATATPRVLQDIQEGLGMMPSNGECVIRVGNLDRVNLFYRVTYVDALLRHAAVAANAGAAGTVLAATGLRGRGGEESDDSPLPPSHRTVVQVETDPQRAHLLAHLRKMHTQFHVQNLPCAGIVYCRKREQVVELANFINRAFLSPSTASEDRRGDSSSSCSFVRVRATSYHGGMSAADRADAQEGWTKGRYHVVVATSAFGERSFRCVSDRLLSANWLASSPCLYFIYPFVHSLALRLSLTVTFLAQEWALTSHTSAM
jgi:superfamily II DNA helicase RecQ